MVIDIYDSNNVLRRAAEKHEMPSAVPMGFRQRYEFVMAKPAGTQIWVWDGRGHNEMRQAILPCYKSNREPAAEDIFAQVNLFRKVLGHSHAIQVTVEGWEADDVISTLVKKFNKRKTPVTVHSNDIDYGQLEGLCRLNGVNTKGTPGRWLPLRKAVVGKLSDAMTGIPGYGEVRFNAMIDYWPQMERAIELGSAEGLAGLPFTPAPKAWVSVPENAEWLKACLTVARFFDVPDDEILGGWKQGVPDRMKAHEIMTEFFL